MSWFKDTFKILYLSAFFAAAPLVTNLFGQAKQDSTHILQLKDPSGSFYTWTKEIPDTVFDLGTIGIFPKLPSSDAYPDNLATIVDQFTGTDSVNTRWSTLPIPVDYGSNTSSGVSFDSLARAKGSEINANVGRTIISESGVAGYGIIFTYGDSSSIDIQRNPDGTPQLAVVTVQKDLYNPENTITGLFAHALGVNWSLDRTSVSGNGSSFSPIDYQNLKTWFNHPVGYDFTPTWGDTARGDTEKPMMSLVGPDNVTTNTPVLLDATASTDNTGIIEFLWDTDFNGFFDPDTTTTTGTLETVFTSPDPSDRSIMVVGKDANNNLSYAEKNINIIANATAPVFEGYQIFSSRLNNFLSIANVFSDPTNPNPSFTYLIISSNFPNLLINSGTGRIGSSFALPDSMAGKAYYAEVAANNGSEVTSTTVDWIVNKFVHTMTYLYTQDGVQQPIIELNGSDRLTNYLRNQVTSAGFFGYNQNNPQQLQEIAQRQVNRPEWATSDFKKYNFNTNPSWQTTATKLDSVLNNQGSYQIQVITLTVSSN